jgi:hypothetical protein
MFYELQDNQFRHFCPLCCNLFLSTFVSVEKKCKNNAIKREEEKNPITRSRVKTMSVIFETAHSNSPASKHLFNKR